MADAADEAFVRYKSADVVRSALANLRNLHPHPCATALGAPLAGRTTFVVGAGHSLVGQVHQLAEAEIRGAPIITVNSGDPILRTHDIVPTALVIRESLIHDDTIAASSSPLIVADIGCHPDTWKAAGDRLAWFLPGYPHTMTVCQQLGVRPSYGGSAALTAAVNLARLWGASRIVLVGVDCCLSRLPDGTFRGYHPDAPRGDQITTLHEEDREPGTWYLKHTGNAGDDARAKRTGQQPQPKQHRCSFTTSWDWGSQLPTFDTLQDQQEWLEVQAQRHGKHVDLVNTSKGAGIAGWRQAELADVVASLEPQDPVQIDTSPRPVTKAHNEWLIEKLDAGAQAVQSLATNVLDGKLSALSAPLLHYAPIPEALSVHKVIDAPADNELASLRYTYEAVREQAGKAREILNRREAT